MRLSYKRDRQLLRCGRRIRSRKKRGRISRRQFVGYAGLVSLGSIVSPSMAGPIFQPPPQGNLESSQIRLLKALVDRLIPGDGNGPGALEAGVAQYIDRQLGDFLRHHRETYQSGLAAVQAFAKEVYGASFLDISPSTRDEVLLAIEANRASGFSPDSRTFFETLWRHTLEGMFADPYYGGNIDFAGWKLIGYPGPRLAVGPEQQVLDAQLDPLYESAFGRSDGD